MPSRLLASYPISNEAYFIGPRSNEYRAPHTVRAQHPSSYRNESLYRFSLDYSTRFGTIYIVCAAWIFFSATGKQWFRDETRWSSRFFEEVPFPTFNLREILYKFRESFREVPLSRNEFSSRANARWRVINVLTLAQRNTTPIKAQLLLQNL